MKVYLVYISCRGNNGIGMGEWEDDEQKVYASLSKAKEAIDRITKNDIFTMIGADDNWRIIEDEIWTCGDILYGREVVVGDNNDGEEDYHCTGYVSFTVTEQEVIE